MANQDLGAPPHFERVDRNEAIYSEGSLELPMTVETFLRDGQRGTAVYLDQALREHPAGAALASKRDAIVAVIRQAVEAEGRLCEFG